MSVLGDKVAIDQVLIQENVEHTIEQRDVGAGPDRKMQIGKVGGLCAPWVPSDKHDPVRLAALSLLDAFEDDRMTVGGVGADQEKAVGDIEVSIRQRWAVGSERFSITRCSRSHAQPGVGVEIIRAEKAFGELVANVVLLGGELAGPVKRHCVRTVGGDNGAKALCEKFNRHIPRYPRKRTFLTLSDLGVEQPIRSGKGLR